MSQPQANSALRCIRLAAFAYWTAALVVASWQTATVVAQVPRDPYNSDLLKRSVLAEPSLPGSVPLTGDSDQGRTGTDWIESPDNTFDLASAACPPRWYLIGDAFALQREGQEGTTDSRAFRLPDWDFQLFGRFTVGHTRDCLNGWEVTYVGGGKWRNSATVTGTGLTSQIAPGVDIDPSDLSAFNNAVLHFQQYESELHSAEVSRKWFGWDVLSVRNGVRWIHLDDEFTFFSVNNLGAQGLEIVDLQNDLILWQLGIDLMRPLGPLTYGGKLAGGIGLNINNGRYFVSNGPSTIVNNSSDSEEFAYLVEAGYFAYYRLTPCVTVRVGYEGWLIGGLALAADQIRDPLTSASGFSFDEHGVIFVHGGSAGLEIVW